MLLKSELEVMWWMMRFWCADTRRGVGDEHCSADSGGGDVRAPPALSDHSCNRESINHSLSYITMGSAVLADPRVD